MNSVRLTMPTSRTMLINPHRPDGDNDLRWRNIGRAVLVVGALYLVLLLPLALHLALTPSLVATVALAVALVGLSAFDMVHLRLPDRATLPLIGGGLAYTALTVPDDVVWHGASAAVAYVCLWLLARVYAGWRGRPGLGLGDAKLYAAAGAWLGGAALPSVLLIGAVAALVVVGAARLLGKSIEPGSKLPFGPFIALGFWVVWLYGPLGVAA